MKMIPYVIKYFKEVIFTELFIMYSQRNILGNQKQSIYDNTLNQKIDENIARFI